FIDNDFCRSKRRVLFKVMNNQLISAYLAVLSFAPIWVWLSVVHCKKWSWFELVLLILPLLVPAIVFILMMTTKSKKRWFVIPLILSLIEIVGHFILFIKLGFGRCIH
ncbi:hypothetical protein, partial [uncultured Pseudoalteromonas sp.]|uniref:hypothetical protein n=1 Tax=uncultured Pseudoalteromonas sp. TaxID=114053 RepID=UPI002616B38F